MRDVPGEIKIFGRTGATLLAVAEERLADSSEEVRGPCGNHRVVVPRQHPKDDDRPTIA